MEPQPWLGIDLFLKILSDLQKAPDNFENLEDYNPIYHLLKKVLISK